MAAKITVHDLTMAYGDLIIMKDLNFEIADKDIFAIIGSSGCGKSTLLRHLMGLQEPTRGSIYFGEENFTAIDPDERRAFMRRFGVMYQSGALWSSLTLGENISMLLEEAGTWEASTVRDLVAYKLALVGLSGFEDFYPAQISGGMKKRAAIARAMALDPDILFLDEPSSGLDPLSSRRLDELILGLRDSQKSTIVIVTHELASIFSIATQALFLDTATKTQGAIGPPCELRDHSDNPAVRLFLNRGSLTTATSS
jgi:phospholipid/cholesterol/gamma-HCH transport system ATP-binding protein